MPELFKALLSFLGGKKSKRPPERQKLFMTERPGIIYAIGDVHGRYDLLVRLEQKIIEQSAGEPGKKLIVMLGDYIDRGPQSRQVIEHMLAPAPEGFERICLAGNHEEMMLDFLANPADNAAWLDMGGIETLASYNIAEPPISLAALRSRAFKHTLKIFIPEPHVQYLSRLPSLLVTPDFIFAHAGIRPGIDLKQQSDSDLLWIRRGFLDAQSLNLDIPVVHGHTPVPEPSVSPERICIDTGAFKTGRLTALKITTNKGISFIFSD